MKNRNAYSLILTAVMVVAACDNKGADPSSSAGSKTTPEHMIQPRVMPRRGSQARRAAPAPTPTPKSDAWPVTRSKASPHTPPGGFRFAWPLGSKIKVIERVVKKRRQTTKATMSYVLKVQRMPGGSKDLQVSWHEFDFVEVGGQPVTKVMRAQMGNAIRLGGLIPQHRISSKGELKELIGFDRMYKAAFADLPTRPGSRSSPEQTRLMIQKMKPIVQQQARVIWAGWVEFWIGLTLKPGESRKLKPTPQDPAVRVLRHHGGVAMFPGHVELSMEVRMTGPKARKALGPLLGQLGAAMPTKANKMLSSIKSVSVVQRIRVITKPTTLVPVKASRHKVLSVDFGGGRVLRGTEQHDYTFKMIKE